MGAQQFSDADIMTALEMSRGLIYNSARLLGCSAQTIYDRVKVSPAVAECLKECRGLLLDKAENKLVDKIDAGDFQSIALLLKTLGKDRGYVERSELTGKDASPLSITTILIGGTDTPSPFMKDAPDVPTPPG